jgi:hypothetical protein
MIGRVALLTLIGLVCGGWTVASAESALPSVPIDATPAQVQSAAERIVGSFAGAVSRLLDPAVYPPSVEVRNTPNLAYFDQRSWTIVLAHWPTLDRPSRGFFLEVTETPEDAAALFVGLFNDFLVAHEMAHWFYRTLGIELDHYTSERQANDIAVAFYMGSEDGEARLVALRPRVEAALARLSNPAPPDTDASDYFNGQYASLARNPTLYGYYQFRFILDSIDRRAELDLASLVLAAIAW